MSISFVSPIIGVWAECGWCVTIDSSSVGIIGKAEGPSRGVVNGVPVVSGVWKTSWPPADLICIWRLGLTWPLLLTKWSTSVQWISAGACSCS